jgi:uncharacterized membrane protein YbhN (UPF0104 family)
MSLGTFIGEVLLRGILENLLYPLSYWTGSSALKVVTLGRIRIAALRRFGERNRERKKWHQMDWSIWLNPDSPKRILRAECVCITGVLIWVAAGLTFYLLS